MATAPTTTYIVVTPVQMDKRYAPGSPIELNETDASQLLRVGAVKLPVASEDTTVIQTTVTVPVSLGASTLGKLNVAELTSYAQLHGVSVDPAWSKDVLLKMVMAVTGETASTPVPEPEPAAGA